MLMCLLTSASVAEERQVYDPGGDVTRPQIVRRVLPKFTEKSRKTHVSGSVLIGLIVNEQGDPESVEVKKSLEEDLDQEAVEAVKQWKFRPGTKQGKAVAVRLSIEIEFKTI